MRIVRGRFANCGLNRIGSRSGVRRCAHPQRGNPQADGFHCSAQSAGIDHRGGGFGPLLCAQPDAKHLVIVIRSVLRQFRTKAREENQHRQRHQSAFEADRSITLPDEHCCCLCCAAEGKKPLGRPGPLDEETLPHNFGCAKVIFVCHTVTSYHPNAGAEAGLHPVCLPAPYLAKHPLPPSSTRRPSVH